jgi:hypothetical protein
VYRRCVGTVFEYRNSCAQQQHEIYQMLCHKGYIPLQFYLKLEGRWTC